MTIMRYYFHPEGRLGGRGTLRIPHIHRRGRSTFRNAPFSRKQSHPSRISRVRLNQRISIGGPFGDVLKNSGVASGQLFQFSTKYQDTETGLFYYGYRYYQTSTGTWVTRDPSGELGGLSIYSFAYNNPVRWFDYLGQEVVFEGDRSLQLSANTLLEGAKKTANAELKKKIAEIEADKFSCKIQLTFDSKTVIVGSYLLQTIDLGDIGRFPESGGAATRYGAFIHEFIEQWEKQKDHKPFMESHQEAMKAEFGVTGNTRGAQGNPVANPDGSISIPITYTHKIVSKIVNNGVQTSEEKNVTITQTLTIKDGNIVVIVEQ